MTVNIEKIPNEPIIMMHFGMPFDANRDLHEANLATAEYMQKVGSPVCRIEDITGLDVDFGVVVNGLAAATQHIPGSMSDPNVYNVMVGHGDLSELIASSFSQKQYGGKPTPIFKTVDEALAHAREEFAAHSG